MATKEEMINEQLKGRDIHDSQVLEAMRKTDRSIFVPEDLHNLTYADRPLPIGKSQTISQPYIVAYMAQALDLNKDDKVLEIGTGCGYNATVLSHLAKEIYSIEIIEWLGKLAKENLRATDRKNIHTRVGDGFKGWPEEAPFDAIELTAAPPEIPETLKKQLKIGGKLLTPVGRNRQQLVLIERTGENKFHEKNLIMVSFVPMTGQAQKE